MADKFTELSSAKIQSQRSLVISAFEKGGFTLSQKLFVEEGKKVTDVFLKGSIHIDGVEELENLRDALNIAVSKAKGYDN